MQEEKKKVYWDCEFPKLLFYCAWCPMMGAWAPCFSFAIDCLQSLNVSYVAVVGASCTVPILFLFLQCAYHYKIGESGCCNSKFFRYNDIRAEFIVLVHHNLDSILYKEYHCTNSNRCKRKRKRFAEIAIFPRFNAFAICVLMQIHKWWFASCHRCLSASFLGWYWLFTMLFAVSNIAIFRDTCTVPNQFMFFNALTIMGWEKSACCNSKFSFFFL